MLTVIFLLISISCFLWPYFSYHFLGVKKTDRKSYYLRAVIWMAMFFLTEFFLVPVLYSPELVAEEKIVEVTPYGDDEIRIQTEEGNEYTVSYDTAMEEELDLEHPEQQKILVKKEDIPKYVSLLHINKFSYEFEDIE